MIDDRDTKLESQFRSFSKFGDTHSDGRSITLTQSDKWMKQANVIDNKRITTTDTAIAFNKFRTRTMTYPDYLKYVDNLARVKNTNPEKILNRLANCGPPGYTPPPGMSTDVTPLMEALLSVENEGSHKTLVYATRSLTVWEQFSTPEELETNAVLWTMDEFKPFMRSTEVTIVTENHGFVWINKPYEPKELHERWGMIMDQYSTTEELFPEIWIKPVYVEDPKYHKAVEKIMKNPENHPNWKVVNGQLMKLVGENDWKILVPHGSRKQIIKAYHRVGYRRLGYHSAAEVTLEKIKEQYYWPGMAKDIMDFVSSCRLCSGEFTNYTKPWQIISVNLIGPFPKTKLGNRYLLAVVDTLTKVTFVYPVKSINPHNLLKFLEQKFFVGFGVPQRLMLWDGGSEYKSRSLKLKMQELGIRLQIAPFYIVSSGSPDDLGNIINTLKTVVMGISGADPKRWDRKLPQFVFPLRSVDKLEK